MSKVFELEKNIEIEFKKSFINKKLELLIEKKDDQYVYGYVKQYFYVKAKGSGNIGDLVDVIIEEVNELEVLGHVA